MGQLLPKPAKRAVYLDADVLVRASLADLDARARALFMQGNVAGTEREAARPLAAGRSAPRPRRSTRLTAPHVRATRLLHVPNTTRDRASTWRPSGFTQH